RPTYPVPMMAIFMRTPCENRHPDASRMPTRHRCRDLRRAPQFGRGVFDLGPVFGYGATCHYHAVAGQLAGQQHVGKGFVRIFSVDHLLREGAHGPRRTRAARAGGEFAREEMLELEDASRR